MNKWILAFMLAASVANADSGAMLASVEGANDAPPPAEVLQGSQSGGPFISRANMIDHEGRGRAGTFSLTDISMIMGPAFNSMSTDAPSSSRPYSGIGTRHLLRLGYALSRRVEIAPTLDVADNFYDSRQGRLIFNDPSVRLSIMDVTSGAFGSARYNGSLWFSAYAPTSQVSQELNRLTELQLAYVPRLHLRGSRFSFSGIGRLKAEAVQSLNQSREMVVGGWLLAEQAEYQASRKVSYFLMNHINGNLGPQDVLVSRRLSSENYRKKVVASQSVFDCFMLGTKFNLTPGVDLSPRLDWLVNLPISSTTVGLNAAFHLI